MKKHYDNDLLSKIKDLIKNELYDEAEHRIEEYKYLYPNDLIVNKYLSKVFLKKGLFEEAEKICLDIINRGFHVNRLRSDMYIALAEVYQVQKRIQDAIYALERALELKDENTQIIQIRLSSLYERNNERDKAFQILESNKNNNIFNKNIDLQKAYIHLKY